MGGGGARSRCRGCSPQLQLKRGVLGGKSECVVGEKELGCPGTLPAALAKSPWGVRGRPGSPPAPGGTMLRSSHLLSSAL